MNLKENKNIFKKIKNEDIKAFERLFKEYYQSICNYVYSIVKNIEIAEEITQNMFVNIWQKREQISIKTSVKSYLLRSAYNSVIDYLRHEKIKNQFNEFVKYNHEKEFDAFETIKEFELNEAINDIINKLPERSKKIFIMNRFEGLKYNEIAQKLSISTKTVEAEMGKTLKILKKYLKKYIEIK